MYIETDAVFRTLPGRVMPGRVPGERRWVVALEWVSGKVGVLDYFQWRTEHSKRPKMGQVVEYAGIPVQVIHPNPEWVNGAIVVKYKGWWTNLLCAWYWLRRHLFAPLSNLFLRTMWAWYLLDYERSSVPSWHNFKPYRWLRKKR